MKPTLSAEDARLLFALVDAADEAGLLHGISGEERWRDIKRRIDQLRYQQEGGAFWDLMLQLEHNGKLGGTWIIERWLETKSRIERNS